MSSRSPDPKRDHWRPIEREDWVVFSFYVAILTVTLYLVWRG